MARYVLIGAIARPHGLKGDVQVVPFHADSPLWSVGTELALLPRRAAAVTDDTAEAPDVEMLRIKRLSAGPKGRLIVWFDGIGDRNQAEQQKGGWLAVDQEALGELDDGEFWYHEIAGWPVVSTTDQALGTVVRVVDGPCDLLEIRPVRGGETYFIPLVPEFVVDVDRGRSRVIVDPIEGLVP